MYDEIYERYRSELAHEDSLINQRISWFLAAQTILFTALAISQENEMEVLMWILAGVGLISSILVLMSVRAAINTFIYWHRRLHCIMDEKVLADQYPQLSRPGSNISPGFAAARWLPVLLGLAWPVFIALHYLR